MFKVNNNDNRMTSVAFEQENVCRERSQKRTP